MSKNLRDLSGKNISFDQFDMKDMCENPSIVMVAKRGSGKSWVTRAILDYFRKIPAGIIIAPTDKMSSFYGKFFPDTFIYYEYSPDLIEAVLHRQSALIEKREEKRKKGKTLDSRGFIIMDDCLGRSKGWSNDENIKELLFNGRHYHLMYILTMQVPLGIGPTLRSNFDYIFFLATDNNSDIKKMYDHYAGMFPDLASFKQIFEGLTKDYGSMVIINRGTRDNFFDKVKWYKAPGNLDTIYLNYGCKQFRYYHKKNYDKNWRKKVSKFDMNEFVNKKKKSRSQMHIVKGGLN